jgi:dipeptidyl aminopeptidase/acylaminoacyl peptidase
VIAQSVCGGIGAARVNAGATVVARVDACAGLAAERAPGLTRSRSTHEPSCFQRFFHLPVNGARPTMPVRSRTRIPRGKSMNNPLFRASVALVLGCAAGISMNTASAATTTSAIVYTQRQVATDGTLANSSLSLTSPAGTTRPLTAMSATTIDDDASWSPDGTRIAFEHGTPRSGTLHFDVYSLDTRTRALRKLTHSAADSTSPAWGPRNRIALVTKYRDRNCLSVIEETGREHDLFCPPSPAVLMRPLWSTDGSRIFVQAGYDTGGLEPTWRSLAYRIDATTGAAFVLDDRVLDESMQLEFSPDGSRGVFSNFYPYTAPMTRVDFASHALRAIGDGYAPRWSHDGRRIAFTGEVYDMTSTGLRYYEPLYVMNADGSNVRRLTISRTDNHAYTAAQWSRDNVRVLANRRDYLDPSLTVPRFGLRIVNADTRSLRSLPEGYAQPGAWYER